MKNLKYILLAISTFLLSMPLVMAQEYAYVACGESTGIPAPLPQATSIAYTLLIIATPLVLIAFSVITLVKSIVAQKPDDIVKARGSLIKKLIATALVFFVAGMAQFVITRVADSSETDKESGTIPLCLNCYLYNNCSPDTDPTLGSRPGTQRPTPSEEEPPVEE